MPRPLLQILLLSTIAAPVTMSHAAVPAPPAGLQSYLSYPFTDQLTASRDGKRLAWVETRKGVHTIWMAMAPDFAPRAITHDMQDDGQEITSLAFSPDGHVLIWSRGGGEAAGWTGHPPAPNPASATVQPMQEIWASTDGGAPVKLADGQSPVISATGVIAYLKDGQVWAVPASGATPPHRLFYDRWRDADLAWSPDGSRLAFVTLRGDHSFVGIYSGPDNPLTWMSPYTSFDADPTWSPDGRRIAFTRKFAQADYLNLPLVEKPNPFSIWVGNPQDGEAERIWQSPDTLDGSYPLIAGGFDMMWGAGDRLVFRAEMDGWPHLYSLSAAGEKAMLLTPGEFMVEQVTMAPDGRTLYFSANSGSTPGDIDRRHIFSVAIDRPGPKGWSHGTGLEWTPVPVGGKLAFVSSTPTTPMRVVLRDAAGGVRPLPTLPTDYGRNPMVVPRPVTFTAADGTLVHGQLFSPPGGGRHPAMIFVHGGPGRQMLLGWSYVGYYARSYAMNQYLATHGYAVLSVNYRLGIGYGRAFQHAPHSGIAGDAEYQDVLAGAHFLQAQPDVDPARLGIWGGSYGGLLTAQALARNSDIFKAGVDFHGVHDWSLFPGIAAHPRRFERGDQSAAFRSAFESSPEAAMSGWKSPVLLIAGDDDRNVPFDQTVDLARRLRAQGTPFQEVILPNEVHGFLRYHSWLKADSAMVRFLDDNLGK